MLQRMRQCSEKLVTFMKGVAVRDTHRIPAARALGRLASHRQDTGTERAEASRDS